MASSAFPYRRVMLWTVVLFVVALLLTYVRRGHGTQEGLAIDWGGPGVGVVEVEGTILSSDRLVRIIDEMARRGDVRALLVKIESPGGSVVASDEIYSALMRARQEHDKPIVAWLGSVAASGGYYIACAADSIIAHPSSTTGSIGVIVEYPVAEEMFRKLGIRWETITSGPYKSMGSPFEDTTERQRAWFRALIADTYDQFRDVVRTRRGLSDEQLDAYADGRVFTGRQAASWGFADRTGTYRDARALAGQMGGLGDAPRLLRAEPPRRITLWDVLFGRAAVADLAEVFGLGPLDAPHVFYLLR